LSASPEVVLEAQAFLGEGPAWHASIGVLTWVDIHAGDLHFHHLQDSSTHLVHLGEPVGCAAPCRDGRVILALRHNLALYSPSDQKVDSLGQVEVNLPGNRFNDGKCDPLGRFLAGTMDDAEKEASGSLYSYAPNGQFLSLITGLRISNGLAWSPDGMTFYHIDTPTRQVRAFDYDLPTGEITNPRTVISIPPGLGWPDGMTCDSQGKLWIAMWGGGCLTRWDPSNGQLLEAVDLPAINITACTFAGSSLIDLYITSARKGLSPSQLASHPLSGSLFRLRTHVGGMPTPAFG
jgi:sugar lactone lactonase YvrE